MTREFHLILTVVQVLILFTSLCRAKSVSYSIIEEADIVPGPGMRILDGDILVPKNDISGKAGLTARSSKWNNGTVPYVIATGDFTQAELQLIRDRIAEINNKTCIKIVLRKQERDYVRVIKGKGCYSNLGRAGGEQALSLNSACFAQNGTAIHLFFHALGILHEHNRPDRDNYIDVHWNNIRPQWWSPNWERSSPSRTSTFGLPYDYDSVMHYPKRHPNMTYPGTDAFTIKSDPNNTITPGQRTHMSDLDIKRVNKMYGC